ncbi:MAG: hypothetical protein A2Y64_02140 [Candidatus Coatesbacteria bacterium RBG_13_66_14]|uniref:DUF3108 domain-containing protein n=1 Tax=Candidatus Coatesbacteria bacterium RBG_13_66_14 TaxID=1817816 RepID=A0A1F5FGZ0_9BACT|nr:MAG: hypothetical protein A2Y64_02140 [Candidatus Coatesbacteria bacterium RBG_13_66_14]
MKMLCIVAVVLSLALPALAATDDLPFAPGEKLIYSVSYGDTKAGICVMKVVKRVTYEGHTCLKLVMELRSSTAFSDFFYVKDDIESLFDVSVLGTRRYEKHLVEGDYATDEILYYDQENHTITREGDVREGIIAGGCDALAAFYHVRTQDIKVGGELSFPYADATRNEVVKVKVIKKETVTVPAGTFECFLVQPMLEEETGIFRQQGQVFIWVSADEFKIPVKITGLTWFGEVRCELEEFIQG